MVLTDVDALSPEEIRHVERQQLSPYKAADLMPVRGMKKNARTDQLAKLLRLSLILRALELVAQLLGL